MQHFSLLLGHGYHNSFTNLPMTNSFRLSVSKPCNENWDSMVPDEVGRYCLTCNKSVIDFSLMTDKEIELFFIQNNSKDVCGRFKRNQIERITIQLPGNILKRKMPTWQKYLIVLLICFGINLFSVDVILGGKPALYAQTIDKIQKQNKKAKWKNVKKKKSKKWYIDIIQSPQIETFTMGLTQSIPVYKPWINFLDNKFLSKDEQSTQKDSITINKEPERPKENHPGKKKNEPLEFILPQPFLMRRRKPG